jgi:hypothetical protein
MLCGVDASSSFRPHLGASAEILSRIISDLDDSDLLTLYRVDEQTDEFYDGPVPDSSESFVKVLNKELRAPPAHNGTLPALFWSAVSARVTAGNMPCVIVFFTDGDNDDETAASRREISRAAAAISRDKAAVVLVAGVDRENWTVLRGEFAPLGDDRLHLCSASELNLDVVTACVDQARLLAGSSSKEAK